MANLAKYWNPKPKTGVSQIYELFVALKLAYCIQNPNVFLEFVDGRPIYHFCLHGLLLSKLWIVSNESGGCSVGGSHAQRRDSWFCHHQEFWYCRVFYSIYFNFYIWTEGMNRIYAWMNRLLLEATLCSVPVFCIWPSRKRLLNVRQTLCIKKIFWLASAVDIVRYIIVFEQLQLVLIIVML